jgi:hypothetical protein
MILGPVFERFVSESPLSVMSRATIEYALAPSFLDALFERAAERGYTKELLFSTTVDLMSLVVCGRVPHVQSAFNRIRERVPVTLKCVYEKLQHIETDVSAEMVRAVAGRCQGLITELGGLRAPAAWLSGEDSRRQSPGRHPEALEGHSGAQRRAAAWAEFGGARPGPDGGH